MPGIPRDTLWATHHGTIPPWDSTWVNNDSLGHDSIPEPNDTIPTPDTCMGHPCDSFGIHHHRIDRSSGNGSNLPGMPLSVSIYPNPVLESAVVRLQGTEGNVTFNVFESTGRMVISKTGIGNGEFELNRDNLSPGLYFYELRDNDNLVSTGRLVFK
jgi:hypothetical protein